MKKLNILITGGAGFVGSHLANRLLTLGHHVSVIDNLATGFKQSLFSEIRFFQVDLCDYAQCELVFEQSEKIDVVFHLASLINVKESCEQPEHYFQNNLTSLATILELCKKFRCSNFVLASSGSVYGHQKTFQPFSESVALKPVSPYSESKVRCEEFLKLFKGHSQFKALILRYSNVAGSALNLSNGQRTARPYHVFHRAGLNQLDNFGQHVVFGSDYPTNDGTAQRDFIHIEDLVSLNIRVMNYLLMESSPTLCTFNAGADLPMSVLEVFNTMNSLFQGQYGQKQILFSARRLGDPAYLVSDSTLIKSVLNWMPQWTNQRLIAASSVQWLEKLRSTSLEPSL